MLQVEPIVKHVPDATKQFLSVRPPPPAFHEAPPTPRLPSDSKEAAASHEADGGARPLPCGSAFGCENCKVIKAAMIGLCNIVVRAINPLSTRLVLCSTNAIEKVLAFATPSPSFESF